MKKLQWVGNSLKQLKKFPKLVQQEMGYALHVAQQGGAYRTVKRLKGYRGVYEIISDYQTDTYRVMYVLAVSDSIYVLHAFQKKSKKGIKTPKEEMSVIDERLKLLKQRVFV